MRMMKGQRQVRMQCCVYLSRFIKKGPYEISDTLSKVIERAVQSVFAHRHKRMPYQRWMLILHREQNTTESIGALPKQDKAQYSSVCVHYMLSFSKAEIHGFQRCLCLLRDSQQRAGPTTAVCTRTPAHLSGV